MTDGANSGAMRVVRATVLLALAVLVSSGCGTEERTGTVTGVAVDSAGRPAEFVGLHLTSPDVDLDRWDPTDRGLQTGRDGSFTFDLPAGRYTMSAEGEPHNVVVDFTVKPGRTTEVRIDFPYEVPPFGPR